MSYDSELGRINASIYSFSDHPNLNILLPNADDDAVQLLLGKAYQYASYGFYMFIIKNLLSRALVNKSPWLKMRMEFDLAKVNWTYQ